MRHEELTIERLAKSGDGVAHLGGRTVFVEGALPGEKVRATVSEVGRVLRADVELWLTQSPSRRPPPCPLADRCGGCDWLHLDEAEQRRQKEEIVLSALEHLGGLARTGFQRLPMVTGARPLGYRRRAVLHPVGRQLGFFGRGTHQAVAVDRCPALTAPLEALPAVVAAALDAALKDVEQVQLLEAGGRTAIALQLKGAVKARHREKAAALERAGHGVVLAPKTGHCETFGKVELVEDGVHHRPDAFAQANAEVNARLVAAAVEALALDGTQSVLELYCGNGNFTVPLARRAREVVAAESSAVALQLAQKGVVGSVRFVQGDALKIAGGLAAEGRTFDRLLVDPPRTGAPGIGALTARLQPKRVVYVACDPAALARDAEDLFGRGFKPVSLQLFDLFPQTRHVEAVLVLER